MRVRAAASSRGSGVPAPKDMLATAGRTMLAATQSMPASSDEVDPVPSHAMHRTAVPLWRLQACQQAGCCWSCRCQAHLHRV